MFVLVAGVARPEPEAMGVEASNTFANSHLVHLAFDAVETVAFTPLVTPFVPQGVPPKHQRATRSSACHPAVRAFTHFSLSQSVLGKPTNGCQRCHERHL